MQTSRIAVEEMSALAECASAQAEFDRELPAFCKLVGLTQPLLAKLPMPTLLLLVNMRLFKLLSSKLREFDARISVPTTSSTTDTVQ